VKSTREKARQNLQVAAVNAALEQQLITLECAPVETDKFEFELAGLPAVAWLHDAGFDEVGFYVMVAPTELGRKLHGAGKSNISAPVTIICTLRKFAKQNRKPWLLLLTAQMMTSGRQSMKRLPELKAGNLRRLLFLKRGKRNDE
jgi:hypothetical protein